MSDQKRVLTAHDGLGYVYECSCGTIHLGLGPMDLRLTRERLVEIHQMLGEAITRVRPLDPENAAAVNLKIYRN